MLHYDTATGGFLTHYHTWEAAISPAPDSLQQVFTPGAHTATLQQAGMTNRWVLWAAQQRVLARNVCIWLCWLQQLGGDNICRP
jgi:hypothetical protein